MEDKDKKSNGMGGTLAVVAAVSAIGASAALTMCSTQRPTHKRPPEQRQPEHTPSKPEREQRDKPARKPKLAWQDRAGQEEQGQGHTPG